MSYPMGEPDSVVEQLRALMVLMREHGCTELVTAAGARIVLSPEAPPSVRRGRTDTDDPEIAAEVANLTEEERAERSRERAHYDRWRRLTASSGAPIPPYRKRVVAPPAPPTPPEQPQ